MVIATHQKHHLRPLQLRFSLEKKDIEQVPEHPILGVVIDVEMKWQPHHNNLCKIVFRKLFLLSQLRCNVNATACTLFYNARILSHINNAYTVWDRCSKVHQKKKSNYSLHRRAAKFILLV